MAPETASVFWTLDRASTASKQMNATSIQGRVLRHSTTRILNLRSAVSHAGQPARQQGSASTSTQTCIGSRSSSIGTNSQRALELCVAAKGSCAACIGLTASGRNSRPEGANTCTAPVSHTRQYDSALKNDRDVSGKCNDRLDV